MKPPPRVVNKVEYEPADPPIVRNRCVKVSSRSGGCYNGSSRSYHYDDYDYSGGYDDYGYGYDYGYGGGYDYYY
jgi:hypothetical protein